MTWASKSSRGGNAVPEQRSSVELCNTVLGSQTLLPEMVSTKREACAVLASPAMKHVQWMERLVYVGHNCRKLKSDSSLTDIRLLKIPE